MAIVVGPLHSSEARGRVSGLIYNTWRGRSYAKAFCSPAQPRQARQLQIRAWTTYLVRYWQLLGVVKMGYWNDYAVAHPDIDWSGNAKRLTGLNWFVRLNIRLLDLTLPIIEDPPAVAAPAAPVLFNLTGAAGALSATWTAEAGTNLQEDLFLLGPVSAGVLGKITKARHAGYSEGESPPINVSPLAPGTYWGWLRVIDEDTGLASPWVTDLCTVT